jgi:tRNA (cytidine/uridine-2'-O-)-methyltransferase
MEIILYQPQIPQNTGNIARTCAVTGTSLRLVRPLGFSISDKTVKRSGLDYWKEVDLQEIEDLEEYLLKAKSNFWFFSSHATRLYTDISYGKEDLLIFGSETKGLPPKWRERYPDKMVTIPMRQGVRCLNLATSAGIVLYEALRQHNFDFH